MSQVQFVAAVCDKVLAGKALLVQVKAFVQIGQIAGELLVVAAKVLGHYTLVVDCDGLFPLGLKQRQFITAEIPELLALVHLWPVEDTAPVEFVALMVLFIRDAVHTQPIFLADIMPTDFIIGGYILVPIRCLLRPLRTRPNLLSGRWSGKYFSPKELKPAVVEGP